MELFSLTDNDLKEELFRRAKDEGVATQEEFASMVDAVIEDHRRVEELSDDQDLELKEDELEQLWSEYKEFIQ